MGQVFVSYVREDRSAVARLRSYLEKQGFVVWWDRAQLQGGDEWSQVVRNAIEQSDSFVACISDSFGARPDSFMCQEIDYAHDLIAQGKKKGPWFIPARLRPASWLAPWSVPKPHLPPWMNEYHWVDVWRGVPWGALSLAEALLAIQNPSKLFAQNLGCILERHVRAKIKHYKRQRPPVPIPVQVERAWRSLLAPSRLRTIGELLYSLSRRAIDSGMTADDVVLDPSPGGPLLAVTYVPGLSEEGYLRTLKARFGGSTSFDGYRAQISTWLKQLLPLQDWRNRDLVHIVYMCQGAEHNLDVLYVLNRSESEVIEQEFVSSVTTDVVQYAAMYPTSLISTQDYGRLRETLGDFAGQDSRTISTGPRVHYLPDFEHYQDGKRWLSQGEHELAISAFTASIEATSLNTAAYNARGVARAMKSNYDEALADFEQAITCNPENDRAHFNRGRILMHAGKTVEAIRAFETAAALNGDIAEYHWHLTKAYDAAGDDHKGRASLERAISLKPSLIRDAQVMMDATVTYFP